MIPNEKKKDGSLIKKRHGRSSSAHVSPINTSNEPSSKGWLESVSVQVKPSRSLDRKPPFEEQSTQKTYVSQKDISDEDILKLTEITAQLPQLTTLSSTKPRKQPSVKPIERPKPISIHSSISSHSENQMDIASTTTTTATTTTATKKKTSWLHKLKSNRSSHSDISVNEKTPAACMVEEFYQKHGRTVTSEPQDQSYDRESLARERRHSFDSFRSFQTYHESSSEKEEEPIQLLFDYLTLPKELKSLIDTLEAKGKVTHAQKTVWFENKDDNGNSDTISTLEEEEEEELGEENGVYFKDIIKGKAELVDYKSNPTRDIAILTTSSSENIEFTKLVQIPSEKPDEHGPLLDLQISLMDREDEEEEEEELLVEIQEMIHELDLKLTSIDTFKSDSRQFLQTHMDPSLLRERPLARATSNPQLTSIPPQPEEQSTRHSMYESDTTNPFNSRIKSTMFLVHSLEDELEEFKTSLDQTELLIDDVQMDIADFRNRMEVYIKDIPESHYSALKQLELDIESILSKRAKNPWMDTGYALLSYLLTLFALGVWIVIYMIKLTRRILMFPFKLWKDYSDYLEERNKAVKKASMRSVSTVRHNSQSALRQKERASSSSSFVTAYDGDSLFLQKTTHSQKKTT